MNGLRKFGLRVSSGFGFPARVGLGLKVYVSITIKIGFRNFFSPVGLVIRLGLGLCSAGQALSQGPFQL